MSRTVPCPSSKREPNKDAPVEGDRGADLGKLSSRGTLEGSLLGGLSNMKEEGAQHGQHTPDANCRLI